MITTINTKPTMVSSYERPYRLKGYIVLLFLLLTTQLVIGSIKHEESSLSESKRDNLARDSHKHAKSEPKPDEDTSNLIHVDNEGEITLSKQAELEDVTSSGGDMVKRLRKKYENILHRTAHGEFNRSPVILVPGYGGSRLEAKLNKEHVVSYFCDTKTGWSDIWINVKLLLPYMIDCLIDNLRLEFDPNTNTTSNTPGVDIRVKDANLVSSVEYLHNLPISGFAYFAPIIKLLTKHLDYEREVNIKGAPYDFRKAPNELELVGYFDQLKFNSEEMYLKNGNQKVTYICHSMGCNMMLYFLHKQSQEWKDTHVKRLISIAAPWAGSMMALRATALGDDLGMPFLFSESKLIQVQRSLPSTLFLFPHPKVFNNIPLIKSNVDPALLGIPTNISFSKTSSQEEKVYHANDFKTFFEAIQHPDGYRMWLNTKDLLGSLEAPGVEVWCFVGKGQKTLGRMDYVGDFPLGHGTELFDDGDGTVNIQSAEYCKKWSSEQKQAIHYKEFEAGHMDILKDERIIKQIESIIESETK